MGLSRFREILVPGQTSSDVSKLFYTLGENSSVCGRNQ
jgi:hypothetical protein